MMAPEEGFRLVYRSELWNGEEHRTRCEISSVGHDVTHRLYNVSMPRITDMDRTIFSEAVNTVLDNFTDEDQEVIHRAASDLKKIFQAAKKRREQSLNPILPAHAPESKLVE